MPNVARMQASREALVNEFPEEKTGLARLFDFLESGNGQTREVALSVLQGLVLPASDHALAQILVRLSHLGIVTRIVRFEPGSGGAAIDYASILDVPLEHCDIQSGRDVKTTLEQIYLIYRVNSEAVA